MAFVNAFLMFSLCLSSVIIDFISILPGFFRFLMLCRCVDVPKCARYVVCEKLRTEHVVQSAIFYLCAQEMNYLQTCKLITHSIFTYCTNTQYVTCTQKQ